MEFRKKRDCTLYADKKKALISFAVTAKLICVFVFAYAKCLFSYDVAQFCLDDSTNIGSLMFHDETDINAVCAMLFILYIERPNVSFTL